ncbi:glycosyltransferase family 39 protein [Helicobacter turcicus]|uniref:Glycosyltransferase family 39 protein n=1 Tax=Helicobacter turcicus TaxID=2867412 RepID=A0ABS7JNT9_9HELI|nr:glycosyltransferase family 39 protein [Helicobacter turcicus]MBX7491080.1 glycosyltransferase family 39 protein [Helicobacter turcicus]MBX7545945.1 glycosyltransferase family 39 protein [Helicobacter turcicus]
MESQIRIYVWLSILLLASLVALFGLLNTLSISYDEAQIFFEAQNFAHFASRLSTKLFGQNDFALRLPFLLLHFCNTLLIFYLSKNFLKRQSDALFAALLFCLLPGVNAVALLVCNVGIVIFFTLLLCIIVQKTNQIPYFLLIALAFIDESFALLFLALIFYSIAQRDTKLLFASLLLFALNMYLFGLSIGGHPKGYFLDANGHLMLIFSPLLYLYFLYTLYRYFNAKTKPLMWYITFCALMFIWLLSLRQRVQIELFAPFLLLGIPLMTNLYLSGLRVRLPQFRARYRIPFLATFIVLLAVSVTLFLSKPLFVFIPDSNEHFAHRHFIAKELANALHKKGVTSVNTDETLQLRLKFYGIQKGGAYLYASPTSGAKKIPISYYGKNIATFYLK